MLFTMLIMVQQIYDLVFARAESFPLWFGGVSLVAGSASILNAAIVERIGMRRIVTWSMAVQFCLTGGVMLTNVFPLPEVILFAVFVAWQCSIFFMAGTTLGNLNAIAMEPMGHIAGMAASVIGGISTIVAAAIAAPVGLLFNGTMWPMAIGIFVMSCLGFVVMLKMAELDLRGNP
jgi:DHA1 family bicyclomycin/chloramphenicol resistance-like MFS transporter